MKLRNVELALKLFVICVALPWMLGLCVAAATVEPLLENFIMIFRMLAYTAVIMLPLLVAAGVLELVRERRAKGTGSDGA